MIALALALLMAAEPATTPTPVPTRRPGPTFCAEWVRQTKEGYERLTLFTDHTLVWKTSAGGQDDVRRKTIAPAETEFYCTYFSREEFWSLPGDLRSGLTGEHLRESRVTLTRSDGSRKAIRFDELSSFSPESLLCARRGSASGTSSRRGCRRPRNSRRKRCPPAPCCAGSTGPSSGSGA